MRFDNHVSEDTKAHIADSFKNTKLGLVRIAKNLSLHGFTEQNIIQHCLEIIKSTPAGCIEIRGKNYYLYSKKHSAVLTINRSSLGIITAKPYR